VPVGGGGDHLFQGKISWDFLPKVFSFKQHGAIAPCLKPSHVYA
jgi:hypothetical protein